MLTRISNLRSISADSSVSSNDVRKIIFPTGSLTNNGSGTITLAFSGDGSSFTNLNAGNLASGTLADARLSSNIPLKNAANTFTNANTIVVSSPAMVNLILQGAASQASDLMQFQNSSGTVLSSFDKNGNLGLNISGSLLGRLHIKGVVQTMYVGDNANTSAVYAQFQNLGGQYYMGVDNNTGTALWTGGIAYASSFGTANGTPLQLATNNTVRITINQSGNVLINGFGSSVIGMTVKGAVSQTADLFQTQDSNGNILNSFTASGQQSFYGLSSTTNRQQGFVQSTWKTSTDATRLGQLNFGVTGIIAGSEANETAFSIIAQDCNLTYYVNEYALSQFTSYVQINVASATNRDVVQQFKIYDGTVNRLTIAHDTASTRMRLFAPNGTTTLTWEVNNGAASFGSTGGISINVASGTNTGFQGNASFLAICNGNSWIMKSGNDTVRLISQGMATQTADLMQFQNSTGAVLSAFKSNGNLGVGTSSSPKGTGNQKIEIAGTGTGIPAYGSLALSRADSTSASLAGSIDFYTVTTLAGQFQCNQLSGGPGGVNQFSWMLGSAGTMSTCMALGYAVGSNTSTLALGMTNGTLQGKLQVTNYASAANTTSIQLSNPVIAGNTGSTSITWVDGAGGNSIGQIRTNYLAAAGVGDLVFSVGQGTVAGMQDFVKFTSSGYVNFYALSSTSTNRIQGCIQPTWKNSTDATRQGQINIGTIAIVSTVETMWTGYSQYTYTFGGGVNRLFGETDIMAESYGLSQADANRPFARWQQYRASPPGIRLSCYNRDTVAFNYQVLTINQGGFGIGTGNASDSVQNTAAIGFTTTETFIDTLGNKLYFGQGNSSNNNLLNLSNASATGAADTFTFLAQHVADATQANTPAINFGARQFAFTTGTANGNAGYLALSIGYSGTSPTMGFFGETAILQPTAALVTTGYTAGASTTMTIDGKSTGGVGSTAYTFGDLVAILKNLGLLAS